MKNYVKFDGEFSIVNRADYESTYKMLSDIVGGMIDCAYVPELSDAGIDVWVNDEGKLLNLTPTLVYLSDGNPVDYLAGPLVFASCDEEGNTIPLDDEQQKILGRFVETMTLITYEDKPINVLISRLNRR